MNHAKYIPIRIYSPRLGIHETHAENARYVLRNYADWPAVEASWLGREIETELQEERTVARCAHHISLDATCNECLFHGFATMSRLLLQTQAERDGLKRQVDEYLGRAA